MRDFHDEKQELVNATISPLQKSKLLFPGQPVCSALVDYLHLGTGNQVT